LSEIVQLAKWNSTVSKCPCMRQLAVVTLFVTGKFRRGCPLTKIEQIRMPVYY